MNANEKYHSKITIKNIWNDVFPPHSYTYVPKETNPCCLSSGLRIKLSMYEYLKSMNVILKFKMNANEKYHSKFKN